MKVAVGHGKALAAALQALQNDPARRMELGQAGVLALQEQFGIEPVAKAISGLYQRILGK